MKKITLEVVFGCCLVILLVFTNGCSSLGGSFGCQTFGAVPDKVKSQIIKGTTTKVWILQELRKPDQQIDLGDGKEQFSYIKEVVPVISPAVLLNAGKNNNTEFWIIFGTNNLVVDFGERPTLKEKNYFAGGLQ